MLMEKIGMRRFITYGILGMSVLLLGIGLFLYQVEVGNIPPIFQIILFGGIGTVLLGILISYITSRFCIRENISHIRLLLEALFIVAVAISIIFFWYMTFVTILLL